MSQFMVQHLFGIVSAIYTFLFALSMFSGIIIAVCG